jgi:hypothetical protein
MNDAAPERSPRNAEMLPQQPPAPAGAGPPEPAVPAPGADEPMLASGLAEDSAGVREELSAALAGAEIGRQERHFMSRLVTWHRANAGPVVALLWKARLAGRAEASMTSQELDTVIGALRDAARYRESGADTIGCWDCENVMGGRCEEHSRDFDKARDCLALAQVLAAIRGAAAKGSPAPATTMKGAAATASAPVAAAAGVLAAPVDAGGGEDGSGDGGSARKIAAKVSPGVAGRRVGLPQQRGNSGYTAPAT